MAKELTGKQRKFVESYTQCWNASQAARDAGYAKTTVSESYTILRAPAVQEYLEQVLQDRKDSLKIDEAYVIQELLRIKQLALDDEDYGNANRAIAQIAKFLGMETKRVEMDSSGISINIITPEDSE